LKQVATFLVPLLLVACGRGTGRSVTLTPEHRTALVDSVRGAVSGWTDAMNHRDAAAAARYYADDPEFRWIENGQISYTSPAEVAAAMARSFAAFRSFALHLVDPTITPLAPGAASVTASFTQTMTDTTGQVTGIAGAVSFTMVDGDSGWRILVGHGSTLSVPSPASSH
jgi:ketosteroid isomerase-like protein